MRNKIIFFVLTIFCIFLLIACLPAAVVSTTSKHSTALTGTFTPASIDNASTPAPTETRAVWGAAEISLGYYTGTAESYKDIQRFAEFLNSVSADVYAVTGDGTIRGSDEHDVVTFDRAHAIQTYACVSNYNADLGDFDPQLAQAALQTHKEKTIAALVSLAENGNYDGINIDFENIHYSDNLEADRAAFSDFIHDLAGQLQAKGLGLIISVPAKTADDPNDTWSYPYDLSVLGKDASFLQLMTYDEHGPWSEPGAVSGADWVEKVLAYSSRLVDPGKLFIGYPAYGYDWVSGGSTTDVDWKDMPALLAGKGTVSHWDAATLSPWLTYSKDGLTHTVWYENAQSIAAKAALVKKYLLCGWSMWALGDEDADFWRAVDGISR